MIRIPEKSGVFYEEICLIVGVISQSRIICDVMRMIEFVSASEDLIRTRDGDEIGERKYTSQFMGTGSATVREIDTHSHKESAPQEPISDTFYGKKP